MKNIISEKIIALLILNLVFIQLLCVFFTKLFLNIIKYYRKEDDFMKKKPDIFKPGITKKLENNNKFFYSALKDETLTRSIDSKIKPKRNLKQEVLLNKKYGTYYLIKTTTGEYRDKIIDRMGNNIIISSGKVLLISDIMGIYEK